MTDALNETAETDRRVRRGVIGVMEREGSLLVIRRAATIPKGGTWCFPGGHIEPGEIPKQAVTRELYEELGIDVAPTQRVGSVHVPDSRHVLAIWRVRHVRGEMRPAPAEVAEVAWMTPSDIRSLAAGLPSNDRVLTLLGV